MKGGSQSQSVTVDPQTQAYVDQMRRYALGATGAGSYQGANTNPQLSALSQQPGFWGNFARSATGPAGATPPMPQLPQGITDAQNQFQQYAQGGNLGFSALTGNAGAAQSFLNPYLSQMNPFFAQQRALAVQGANDQATQMGAFGGDRSGIAAAQAGNLADQSQAGFNYQAFNDAMQRAGFAANLGYGAQAQSAFLPQQWASGNLGLLQQGLGPYGQTQTTKTQGDPFSQLLGLGLTFLGPGGLLAKGAMGAGSQVLGSFGGGNSYG